MKEHQGSLERIVGGTARKRRKEQEALQHWILGLGDGVCDGGGVDGCRGVDVVVEVEAAEDVTGEPADKPEDEEGQRGRDQELAETLKGLEQGEMKGERKKGEERMGYVERGKEVQMQMHRREYKADFQHLMHLRTEKDSVLQRLELPRLDTGTSPRQSPESSDAQALSVETGVHARAVVLANPKAE